MPGLKNIVNQDQAVRADADGAVKSQIDAALQCRARVDSRAIRVTCHSGTVHLAGEVSSLRERSDAGAGTASTSVPNRIRVVP
jgi:osmotically-inducible protein OsmY